jgi:hypothetical protein
MDVAVQQCNEIAAETETGLNLRLAKVTGHPVGCICAKCSLVRKRQMSRTWDGKHGAEEAEEQRDEAAMAELRRPAERREKALRERAEAKEAERGARARLAAAEHEVARLGRISSRSAEESAELDRALMKVAAIKDAKQTFRKRKKAASKRARVTFEPRVYSAASPFSWYLDLAPSKDPQWPGHAEARARLVRYAKELGSEMARGTKEGQRAERVLRAAERTEGEDEHERRFRRRVAELRAFGTDGGATATAPGEAAAFVSPAFLLGEWAPYRGVGRPFTEQCHIIPLPSFGMHISLPVPV